MIGGNGIVTLNEQGIWVYEEDPCAEIEWHVRIVLNRMNAMLRTLVEIRGLPMTSERS